MKTRKIPNLLSIIFVAVTALMSGCSSDPVYRTSYELTQPGSSAGRQCTTQCETNRLLCEQKAATDQRQCQEDARRSTAQCKQRARTDYNNCMQQASRLGSYRANTERSCASILQSSTNNCDYRQDRCELDTRHCNRSYRSCFTNCGGKVSKKVRCVANCDKSR